MARGKYRGNRSRRNTRGQEGTGGRFSQSAQTSTALAEATIGREVPNHELNTLGVSNSTRHFTLDDPSNGPSAIFRQVNPWDAFASGFSNVDGTPDSGDWNAATNIATTPATTELFPVTVFAKRTSEAVWPVLKSFFSLGTGQRWDITYSEWVRYNAMMIRAYYQMYAIVIINRLTYHFDWTKVFPFTPDVPMYLYQMAEAMHATDVGLAGEWLPRMKRLESKILFPRIVAEIKRVLHPNLSVDLNGRLNVPIPFSPSSIAANIQTNVDGWLDYIDAELPRASALFTSFLPFPLALSAPWDYPSAPVIDVDKDAGMFNSPVRSIEPFNDTSDPTLKESILLETDEFTSMFYSRHVQPTWAEVRLSTIYQFLTDVIDDGYALLTPHRWNNAVIAEDGNPFTLYTYSGAAIGVGSAGFRYIDFANSRFASADLDYGVMKPGLMGAELTYEPVNRLVKVDADYAFSSELIKQLMTVAAGSSVRELQSALRTAVYEGLQSPV